jgi:DNA-binding transcriptional ArsR family regulator
VILLEVKSRMKEFCNEAYYMMFTTLANRTRLTILDVLKGEPRTLSEISDALEQGEDVASENLLPLVKCALVLSSGSGRKKVYCLNKELVEPLSELLEFHVEKYCPGFNKCIPPGKLKEYLKAEAAKTLYIERE